MIGALYILFIGDVFIIRMSANTLKICFGLRQRKSCFRLIQYSLKQAEKI
jgi:hypothetical protein